MRQFGSGILLPAWNTFTNSGLDFYVRIHLRGTHPTLRFKKKRGLRFVRVFCIFSCSHVRCFRRFSFAFTFICLGSALVFCFRQGCFVKGKTKLGSVVDQLYCPFLDNPGSGGWDLTPSLVPVCSLRLRFSFLRNYAFPPRVSVGFCT